MPDRLARMHRAHGEGSDAYGGRGPASVESRRPQAAREASPLVRLADVCETLAIPKSTYEDQRAGGRKA